MPAFKKSLKGLLVFIFILAAWEAAYMAEIWSPYVLPSPGKVFSCLFNMASSGELYEHLYVSVKRVLTGFSISCIIAFILTSVSALFPVLVPYYRYLLGVIRHIPPISLIPLFILWFGIGETPKIIVIVLASVFPVLLNTEDGIFGCSRSLTDTGKMLGLSKREIFFKIMIPSALPEIAVGIRIGLGYAWRAIVGAEMIASVKGIGYLILDAQTLSRTDKVIAGVLVIGFIGFITDFLCTLAEKKISDRFGKGED